MRALQTGDEAHRQTLRGSFRLWVDAAFRKSSYYRRRDTVVGGSLRWRRCMNAMVALEYVRHHNISFHLQVSLNDTVRRYIISLFIIKHQIKKLVYIPHSWICSSRWCAFTGVVMNRFGLPRWAVRKKQKGAAHRTLYGHQQLQWTHIYDLYIIQIFLWNVRQWQNDNERCQLIHM